MNLALIYSNYMIKHNITAILSHPATKRIYWVLFAILFYNSGQSFTIWLLEPDSFKGGMDWIWMLLFPILLPAFFLINRYLGCSSGPCNNKGKIQCHTQDLVQHRMPG